MDRSIALLFIGLIFGGGIGFVVAAGNGVTLDGHDHAEASEPATQHKAHGELLSLTEGPGNPGLDIKLTKDVVSGWNLQAIVSNFDFAPELSGKGNSNGEGHAHVYVNGTKIARLYGPWMHIASLPKGEVVIEVTLNTNEHKVLAIEAEPIKASITVFSE